MMPRAAVLHGECYGIVGSGWRRMAPMGQAERKKRGVDVGASASGREKEERGGPGATVGNGLQPSGAGGTIAS
jgi:hypothetical protein